MFFYIFIRSVIVRSIILLMLFVLNPAVTTSASSDTKPQQQNIDAIYTLGPGDKLKINVYREPDLSGEFQLDGSGSISFPLVGEITAGGLSMRKLEKLLTDKLKDGYLNDPRITIEILNYRPFYIMGEVVKPGPYEYVNGITLYNAIAMAGGYTHRARQNKAHITRSNPETIIEDADHSTLLFPGDIVNIRERFF